MASYGPKVFPAQPVTTTYAGTYPGSSLIPGGFSFLGDAITPADNLYPGSGTFPGQGNLPLLECLLSTSDAVTDPPVWEHIGDKARSFSISRGRNSELDEVDAGTASIVLDNRERDFDPTQVTTIRTRNRIWLRSPFSGSHFDLFHGYIDAIDQQWPGGGMDAVAVVSAVDEFSRLTRKKLPTTSPPRDTYADVVAFDQPAGYWSFDDLDADAGAAAKVGKPLRAIGTITLSQPSPIVGSNSSYADCTSGGFQAIVSQGDSGDVTGLSEFTIELWLQNGAVGAGDRALVNLPSANATNTVTVYITSTGAVKAEAINSAGTPHTATSAVLTFGRWYYVVVTITGGNLRVYLDAVQSAATTWTGPFHASFDADPNAFDIASGADITPKVDELAFYRYGLSTDRISAHYSAGVARGFARSQTAGVRASAVLDTVSSHAPRQLRVGTRTMTGAYMHGQGPLDELRQAARAELPNALLFVAADGTLTLLDDGHRSTAPYSTIQAVFGDAGGSELPYTEIDVDYSESFLLNKVTATRQDGPTQEVSDSASISAYDEFAESITDLPLTSDADVLAVAQALVVARKDPYLRVLSLEVNTADPDGTEAVLALDLGDRIEVRRTPPGGGDRISEVLFVQHIAISADARSPVWRVVLGVSPL